MQQASKYKLSPLGKRSTLFLSQFLKKERMKIQRTMSRYLKQSFQEKNPDGIVGLEFEACDVAFKGSMVPLWEKVLMYVPFCSFHHVYSQQAHNIGMFLSGVFLNSSSWME
jgi:hypothetical protein